MRDFTETLRNALRGLLGRLTKTARRELSRLFRLKPGTRGLLAGALIPGILLTVARFRDILAGAGFPVALAWLLFTGAAFVLLVFLARRGAGYLGKISRTWLWVLSAAILLPGLLSWSAGRPIWLGLLLGALLVPLPALGGWLLALTIRHRSPRPRPLILLCALALAVNLIWILVLGSTGTGRYTDPDWNAPRNRSSLLGLDNPGARGVYPVLNFSYGSGTDGRRYVYGAGIAVRTEPADLSDFWTGGTDWRQGFRDRYWGFGPDRVPVNGRVWYPRGDGPFPLFLMLHGNAPMEKSSEAGYEYLARHLASRGIITVLPDQNFLNYSWAGDLKGSEVPARAAHLLKSLETIVSWNRDPASPLGGKIREDAIVLGGHSRGGEAAAAAVQLNRTGAWPEDGRILLDNGFGITGLVALAPTTEHWLPGGEPVRPEGISALVLAGAHDGDVALPLGLDLYERITLTEPEQFKSFISLYRGNHSGFNSSWGPRDLDFPVNRLLNHRPVMTPEEQQQAARVLISAFLETVLLENHSYQAVLEDPLMAAFWLPEDALRFRYAAGTDRLLAGFSEDTDPSTTGVEGVRLSGEGLSGWEELRIPWRMGGGTQENRAVRISWEEPGGRLVLKFSEEAGGLRMTGPNRGISFGMALPRQEELPEVQVGLVLDGGETLVYSLPDPLGHMELPVRWTKLPWLEGLLSRPAETIPVTCRISLMEFKPEEDFWKDRQLEEIHLIFRGPSGGAFLDDLALTGVPAGPE